MVQEIFTGEATSFLEFLKEFWAEEKEMARSGYS